jgi:hypothetical protein
MLFSKNSEQKGRLLDKYQTDSMDKKCAKVTSNDSTNNKATKQQSNKVKPKHHHYQSIY